jgi:hypothetical protein
LTRSRSCRSWAERSSGQAVPSQNGQRQSFPAADFPW